MDYAISEIRKRNNELSEKILNTMREVQQPITAHWLMKHVEGIPCTQRCVALLIHAMRDGLVERSEKIDSKGQTRPYYQIIK